MSDNPEYVWFEGTWYQRWSEEQPGSCAGCDLYDITIDCDGAVPGPSCNGCIFKEVTDPLHLELLKVKFPRKPRKETKKEIQKEKEDKWSLIKRKRRRKLRQR